MLSQRRPIAFSSSSSSSSLRLRPPRRQTASSPPHRRTRAASELSTAESSQTGQQPSSASPQKLQDDASMQQRLACRQLLDASGTTTSLDMRPSKHQNGLFTTKAVQKGEVIMSVPRHICLIIDYNQGLSVPSTGAWPRLKEGVAAEEPLPWDLLIALALLDGLAGDGGSFWQGYCQAILPAPEALTLPMCWSQRRLQQLQHGAIAEAAIQQQTRLSGMFPDLMEPLDEDTPSWLQWAFACVRSRAYKLGPDAFAMVPFWDLANHDVQPNSDFRAAPGPGPGGALQLIALKDLQPDQEVLISYTGAEGYTNQRLMAQYGFVLPGGNPADRVPLEVPQGSMAAGLSLEHLQSLMGDMEFLEMISAKDAYGYAALKSLPLLDENQEPSASGQAAGAGTGSSRELATELLRHCDAIEQGYATTLQEDEQLLRQHQGSRQQQQAPGPAGGAGGSVEHEAEGGAGGLDEREASAVEYRVERKRLMAVCRSILQLYLSRDSSGETAAV